MNKHAFFDAFAASLDRLDASEKRFVLVAVSGGIDSVVLLHVLYVLGVRCAVAHVNYRLRGNESEEDAAFVQKLAETYGMPFFMRVCSEEEMQGSVQSTARKIRYAFFEKTAVQAGCTSIATAHHFDDSAETLLLQLVRGTGISGVAGIAARNDKLIRPLLQFTRAEIEHYAQQQQLQWRNDSSNQTDKYTRNRIRHHVLPELLQAVPQGRKGLRHSLQLLGETQLLVNHAARTFEQAHTHSEAKHYYIHIAALLAQPAPALLLHSLLQKFELPGYTTAQAMQLIQAGSNSSIAAGNYVITCSRDHLVISTQTTPAKYTLLPDQLPAFVEIEEIPLPHHFAQNPWQATFDAHRLQWPLTLRQWQPADAMQPLGMQGQKNISDILTDARWPAHIRKQTLVMLSGNEIIWLPGCRMAHHTRITENTTQAVRFTFDEAYYQ
ncbi:MAG: tRNA lysidine(34) synthetase TilS [Bacteroidetes bacterium]|nr:tRNA lysidine(34) synthetase TilS [Bacteroidota bacterium]